MAKNDLETENIDALKEGLPNLRKHLDNLREVYGIPTVVAVNRFPSDTDAELEALKTELDGIATVAIADHWAKGGAGAIELAHAVIKAAESTQPQPKFAYELDQPLEAKIEAIATRIYGAEGIDVPAKVKRKLDMFTADGYGNLPVCIAKTQYSFSTDAAQLGAPTGHTVTVRDVRLSAGAGFIVTICGDIMTMPGLPKKPAALSIDVDDDGVISGLF